MNRSKRMTGLLVLFGVLVTPGEAQQQNSLDGSMVLDDVDGPPQGKGGGGWKQPYARSNSG